MKPSITLAFAAAVAIGCVGSSYAQTVWRCGGNVYTDRPCGDGRAVAVADSRNAADLAAAHEVAARERALAERMTQDALQRETSVSVALAGPRATQARVPKSESYSEPAMRPKKATKPLTVRQPKVKQAKKSGAGISPRAARVFL